MTTPHPNQTPDVRLVSQDEYDRLLLDDRARRGAVGFVVKVVPLSAAFWLGWQALQTQGISPWMALLLATGVVAVIYVLLGEVERHIFEGLSLLSGLKFAAPLLVLIMLSVTANLTVVYRKFAGPAVLQEEIDTKRKRFDEIKARLLTSNNDEAIVQKRAEVSAVLDKMISELQSPGKPGAGPLFESYLQEVEKALGMKPKSLPRHSGGGLPSDPTQARALLEDRYRSDISTQLEKIPMVAAKRPQRDFVAKAVDEMQAFTAKELEPASVGLRTRGADSEAKAVDTLAKASALMESTLATAATFKFAFSEDIQRDARFINDGYGSVEHSLRSAFSHLEKQVTWLCIGLALAIDLSALLLVLVITKPKSALLPGVQPRRLEDEEAPALSARANGSDAPAVEPAKERDTSGATGGAEPKKRRGPPPGDPQPGHLTELKY